MRKAPALLLSIAIVSLIRVFAIAQTPTPANSTSGKSSEQASDAQSASRQPAEWRITEKEVIAVQAELFRRGYYKSKIAGVLDRDTRESVRAFQTDSGLKASGRIDLETYQKLGLIYPATGKEADSLRRNGWLPRIGYGVKDTAAGAGAAVTGGVKKAGSGVRTGLEKTRDLGDATVSKSREVAQGAGDATVKGAKSAGRSAGRAGDRLIGRSDAEVHEDVRRAMEENPETKLWYTEVKNGNVTIKTPRGHTADIGAVVSNIRKVPGVKSVFVITL
jgi:peptidoglycan hydrolase-like protein with peptidoglycan-binding domain